MNENSKLGQVPIYNIRMLTDEEWNRLAYENYLQRNAARDLKSNDAE